MKLSEIMTLNEWVIVRNITSEYNVDPKLIAAIGWHETHWGRLGAGRQGWHLGYGYFPGSTVAEKYRGLENQIRGASYQLKRDLKLPISLQTVTEFAFNSWKPGNPAAWAQSVWNIYNSLVDDLTSQLLPSGSEFPSEESRQDSYVETTSIRGLLTNIAGKLDEISRVLREWEV